MYGITDCGTTFLCFSSSNSRAYIFKGWNRVRNPVMMVSATEIDNLLQEIIVQTNNYDLYVFEYTTEQEEEIIIRKLKGY